MKSSSGQTLTLRGPKSSASPPSAKSRSLVKGGNPPQPASVGAATPQGFVVYRYLLKLRRQYTDEELERRQKAAESKDNAKDSKQQPQPGGNGQTTAQNPDQPTSKVQRRLIYLLVKDLHARTDMATTRVVTDYNSFLVSNRPLPDAILDPNTHTVLLYGDHERLRGTFPLYIFTIEQPQSDHVLSINALRNIMTSTTAITPAQITHKNNIVSALNAMFTNAANVATFADLVQAPGVAAANRHVARAGSKKFYDMDAAQAHQSGPFNLAGVDLGYQARLGFFLSARALLGNQSVLLNINTTRAAFRHLGTVSRYIANLHQQQPNLTLPGLNGILHGLRVRTDYLHARLPGQTQVNEALYTLNGLAPWTDAVRATRTTPATPARPATVSNTPLNSDPNTSILQHFQQTYPAATTNLQAGDMLVSVRTPANASVMYLPSSLLVIEPYQRATGTVEMINFAVRNPAFNRDRIQNQGKALFELQNASQPFSPVSTVP